MGAADIDAFNQGVAPGAACIQRDRTCALDDRFVGAEYQVRSQTQAKAVIDRRRRRNDWQARVDHVVGTVGRSHTGVARQISHTGVGQRDDVGGVSQISRWRVGGCPGDAAVGGSDGAECAVNHRQVGVVKACDRFIESDGYTTCLAGLQRGVGHHHGGRGAQRVDGVVGAVGRSHTGVARQISHSGVGQCDEVAGVSHVGCWRVGGSPCDAAVGGSDGAECAVNHRQVGVVKACDRFIESDGYTTCLAGLQRGVGHHHGGRGAQRVDGVVGAVGRSHACIARQISHSGVG